MENIKEYVARKKQELKTEVDRLGKVKMVVVQLGHVPASDRYVRNKIKDAEDCGVQCQLLNYPENTSEAGLLYILESLNRDKSVDGFIVQLPLPKSIDEEKIKLAIDPAKDIDGFHPMSKTVAATPLGIFNYLKDMNYEFSGKNAVIIGRSNIVGKPMQNLLLNASMNTTVLHSKTSEKDKKYYLKNADLIIVATGHQHTLTKDYKLKSDAIIFDVGINVNADGKLCGDCDYADIANDVEFISPVPGGCGLLTRIAVIDNLVELAKQKNK